MFPFSKPVVQLPGLTTSSGADLAARANVAPESKALLKPGMSSSEYIHTLEQNKQSVDTVKTLAHGMSERDSVSWASQSSRKVADKLNPQEKAATQAAETWAKNPSDANKLAASKAASKTDFKGPGGWAAQAAAWSGDTAPASASAPAASAASAPGAAAPALTPAAVTGSVLLAAGLSSGPAMSAPQKPNPLAQSVPEPQTEAPAVSQTEPPPVDQSKMAKSLQPFIDLGKAIASGKNSPV